MSTDSLPISYLSPGSVYTNASSIHTLSADIDGLHRLLATKDITTQVIAGAFEEFAWRGVLRGTRVRDWCEGLRTLLDELHIIQDLYNALHTPSINTLFPFLSLITTPTEVQAHFFYPPPTLSTFQLASLDRDTLVDALLSLLEGSDFVCEDDLVAPVTELVLEHIGSVWRRLIVDDVSGSAMADGIAKALVELEFELQCQGSKSSLRTLIFPIVRRIRFDLGFVTSFQLVSRLKSCADYVGTHSPPCDPHHIIKAWAVRRLNAGTTPQKVHDDLIFIRERVRDEGIRAVFEAVLSYLGLEKKDSSEVEPEDNYSFGRITPTPTPTKKSFSLFSSKKAARRTMMAPKSKDLFMGYPAGFDPTRRPSLPTLTSNHQPFHPNPSPLKSSSLVSFQSTGSNDSSSSATASHAPSLASDLLSQIMTFSDASDVRLILLDYVCEVRYRLHVGGVCDWFFGTGRETAASTLDTLEGRLVGKRDVMDLAAVFGEIRGQFDIPAPGCPIRVRGTRGRAGRLHATRSESSNAHVLRNVPQDISDGVSSRGVSFDIDSYYHRHVEEDDDEARTVESCSTDTVKGAKRKSMGAASQFSLSSALSTNVQPDLTEEDEGGSRASFLSYTFSIREAKVGYSEEARTRQLDPRVLVDDVSESSHDSHVSSSSSLRTFHASRSESSLADAYSNAHTPTSRSFRHRLSPTSSSSHGHGTHLGVPRSQASRSSSPVGSFHSLLSALDLETRHPIDFDHLDLLGLFPDPTIANPSPLVVTGTPTQDRKTRTKQNRQYVVVDHELSPDISPKPLEGDVEFVFPFPPETPTPALEPRRRRYTSERAPRTLDKIEEVRPRAELPLASLLALFSGPLAGDAGSMTPEEVGRAVEAFVDGERRYADELGSGWDGEDQRRVVWLLRQIAAMIPDPSLQYPIHQQILYLARNPLSASNRTSLASTTSTSTSGSTGTGRYPATPATASRPTAGAVGGGYPFPPTPASSSASTPSSVTPPSYASGYTQGGNGYSLGVTVGSATPDIARPRSAAVASALGISNFGVKGGHRNSLLSTFGVGGEGTEEGDVVEGYDLGSGHGGKRGAGERLTYA